MTETLGTEWVHSPKWQPSQRAVQCDWPEGELFTFHDEPGEHDPCYVVMPGGAALPLNHHNGPGVDIARAKFIVNACNAALQPPAADNATRKPVGEADV